MRGPRCVALLLLASSAGACATYQPRPGSHIVRDASGVFHRDGQTFRVGALGGGADALVNGDARALEHVRRMQSDARAGAWVGWGGLIAGLVGAFALAATLPDGAKEPAAFGALGLGCAAAFAGTYLQWRSEVALMSAVNTYNDDVDEARARLRGSREGDGP